MAFPKLRPGQPDFGIYRLEDLPETGLVRLADVLTLQGSPRRRIITCSAPTFARQQRLGLAPPSIKVFGVNHLHSEHVRAIVEGRDWRAVRIPPDRVAAE